MISRKPKQQQQQQQKKNKKKKTKKQQKNKTKKKTTKNTNTQKQQQKKPHQKKKQNKTKKKKKKKKKKQQIDCGLSVLRNRYIQIHISSFRTYWCVLTQEGSWQGLLPVLSVSVLCIFWAQLFKVSLA